MTRDQVKEVIERVLTWPRERQEDAVQMLLALEAREVSFIIPMMTSGQPSKRVSLEPNVAKPYRPTRLLFFSSNAIYDAPVRAPRAGRSPGMSGSFTSDIPRGVL